MLKLRDFVIIFRIVLSISLLLLHQSGLTISFSIPATDDENTTTSEAATTNIAQARSSTPANTTYESLEAANSSLPRRVTVLSRKFMKIKTAPTTDSSSQLSNQPVSTHRPSNFSFRESSMTTSNEKYVRFGANHSGGNSSVHQKALESGFQPFVPSPAIDVLAPKFDLNDAYLNGFDGTSLKRELPPSTKHSHETSESNDYPTYSDVPSRGSFDASYSKYFDKDYSFLGTTFDPTENSLHTYTNGYGGEHRQSALSVPKNKRKPHNGYLLGSPWMNGAYMPDHNFVDGFANQEDNSLDVNGYDVKKAAYIKNKLRIKNSLLHILTTLIPFGLLLSAIPPKVVIINSTMNSTRPESNHQKAYVRNLGQEFLRLNNVSVNDTLDNAIPIEDMKTNDLLCTKLRICEAALGLRQTLGPSSSFEDDSLWHVLSRFSNSAGVDPNLRDILEAVAQKQCSKFACENVSPSAQSPTE